MLVADFEFTNVSYVLESSSVPIQLPTICLFENSLQLLNPQLDALSLAQENCPIASVRTVNGWVQITPF